jgi:selenocysteine-specific elongation factor
VTEPVCIATAGHIDHGKTELVRSLTGHDTDRLAEEKRRGISIELGFAPLDLEGRPASLIDVPGHERFVRTMIAGASGVDLFLMVVAADDGPMPQTIEHAVVLEALGIEVGVVALSKCDRVETQARIQVAKELEELLPDAPVIEVSSRLGTGLVRLRRTLADVAAAEVERRNRDEDGTQAGTVVLHVDRVFTIAGRGTVVTGTLWSGKVRCGDRIRLLPSDREARVREVQVHDRVCEVAGPRQRVALNLAGLKREEVSRGDVITSLSADLRPSYRLDAALAFPVQRLADHERVQVHHGTRETSARTVLLGEDQVQLRLEGPLIAQSGDRLVLRKISPPDTLGGAAVLDARPPRHGPVSGGRPAPALVGAHPDDGGSPKGRRGSPVECGEGSLEHVTLARRALACLRSDGLMPRGSYALAAEMGTSRAAVLAALAVLVEEGDLIRLKPEIWVLPAQLRTQCRRALELAQVSGGVTVAELRDALGTSRKYALAVLEYLDASKVTIRHGDRHVQRNRRPTDVP